MTTSCKLNPLDYYRLPWNLTDNGISWLEVTDACNLACEGCYRPHEDNHKSLVQIAEELQVFQKRRKSDCISIAGGDPLVHPEIVEIVRMISEGGWKPILNTNGLALSEKLLIKLKDAGVYGFTFHIDTTQVRKDAPMAKTEDDLNALRLKFARMLAKVGGIACSFNQTVSADTLDQIPNTVRWAEKYPDIVQTIVFILFRAPRLTGEFDFFANGKKIELQDTYEKSPWGGKKLLEAQDVVDQIRTVDADFEPCAYLSGSVDPRTTKWLMATRIATRDRGFGYVSARFMEFTQQIHHMIKGRWMAYSSPASLGMGRIAMAVYSFFDSRLRQAGKRYLLSVFKNPLSIFKKAYFQTYTIIQPVDMMEDGSMNMCDGCPDMTVHEGELYWSCRLEEIKEYGCFVHAVPKHKTKEPLVRPGMEKQEPEVIVQTH